MGRSTVYLVTDDQGLVQKTRGYFGNEVSITVMTPMEWSQRLNDPHFREGVRGQAAGAAHPQGHDGAKILPFPSAGSEEDKKVRTINELESMAIENAIFEYNGNLTEAAKALGIGRATLYRKVKQYNIDPSQARKKRAA